MLCFALEALDWATGQQFSDLGLSGSAHAFAQAMQDERTCEPTLLEASRSEAVVMLMLLHGGHWWPWSISEVSQELGDEQPATEAVAGLHAAGLVHRFDEFVLPTRPATSTHSATSPSSASGPFRRLLARNPPPPASPALDLGARGSPRRLPTPPTQPTHRRHDRLRDASSRPSQSRASGDAAPLLLAARASRLVVGRDNDCFQWWTLTLTTGCSTRSWVSLAGVCS